MSEGVVLKNSGSSPEPLSDLEMIKLDGSTYADYEREMLDLPHNVLDTREQKGSKEQEEQLTGLGERYLGRTKGLYVILRGGAVVAFVALRKYPEGEDAAVIEQIRTAPGMHEPTGALKEILGKIRGSLQEQNIHRAVIKLAGEHTELAAFKGATWFDEFFSVERSSEAHKESESPEQE